MTTTQDAIAAFLAKGGSVRKIATGEGAGVTDRQWYAASQGNLDLRSKLNGSDDERLAERRMETFRETRHVGGSVSEALDAMNSVR